MTSSLRQILSAITGLALACGITLAQDTTPDNKGLIQQKVAGVKESIVQNQASLSPHHTKGFATYICEHLLANPAQEWFSNSARRRTTMVRCVVCALRGSLFGAG